MLRCSVIITSYNRRDYVAEAVRSIVEQTYPAHEIIVVVDGSEDGTGQHLREAFPKVRVIEQRNMGRSVARNTGIAAATGDWVAFLDDDDLWHRDKLKRAAEYIAAHPQCAALNNFMWFFSDTEAGPTAGFGLRRDFVAATLAECQAAADKWTGSDGNDFSYLQIEGKSHEKLLERNRGALSATLVTREIAIRAGGFAVHHTYAEDWLFFLNVSRFTEWHTIPEKLNFQRLHAAQSTKELDNAIIVLSAKVGAWHGGRALATRASIREAREELKKYGSIYRGEVQGFYWVALRAFKWRDARMIRRLGAILLPRLRDRMYVVIPPFITWRWERYVLGMHK